MKLPRWMRGLPDAPTMVAMGVVLNLHPSPEVGFSLVCLLCYRELALRSQRRHGRRLAHLEEAQASVRPRADGADARRSPPSENARLAR